MNHGPRNAVLVIAMFAFLAGGLFVALPGTALAEDRAQIDQLFDQAQDLWKRGRTEEAAAALKELLAADPTQSTAYDLLRKAENQMFLDLLKAGGDSALAARRLLELAHPGELQRIKDAGAIKALVGQAVHGEDHGVRTHAIRQLLANHGEYTVPFLFPFLGSNDTDERVYAILALTELSSESVLPLIEALQSDSWLIQQNASIVLERIGDVRALAALVSLAKHAEMSAVAAMLAGGCEGCKGCKGGGCGGDGEKKELSPAMAYLKLSKWYYMQDTKVIRNYLGAYTVWSWEDGNLVSREVPKYMYHLELAEECLYDALVEEPGNEVARYALAAIHYAQLGAIQALGTEAMTDEAVQALAKEYSKVMAISAAQGVDAGLGALHIGLQVEDPAISVGAMHVLPYIWDGRALAEDNPLVKALSAEEKVVRFAAAVAVLMIQPAGAFPGSDMVVPLAAQAADTGSARQILVIEPNADVRAASMKALVDGKMFPIGEGTGIRGFRRALEVGTFDVIVIRYTMADMLALALVNQLREDFRTAATPILISGTEAELAAAKEALGTKVQGYVAAELAAGPVADAAAGSLNDDQRRALHVSKFACMALGMIDPGATVFGNYPAAEAALIGVVTSDKPDDIRLAALAALGKIGSSAAADALVGTFTGTANATSVRVAAAAALGRIFKGQAVPAGVFTALLGGFGDEAAEVRNACGLALGGMELMAEQRNAVLTGYRVK